MLITSAPWSTAHLIAGLMLSTIPAPWMVSPARRVASTRALDLFRVGAEKRTVGHTGVLLYLSLAEHLGAKIVTDAAIHAKVRPEVWGEAMAALIDAVGTVAPARAWRRQSAASA